MNEITISFFYGGSHLLIKLVVRLCAGSSLDCVSEEVRGALPSLISLMVSVDVKPYVLLCACEPVWPRGKVLGW